MTAVSIMNLNELKFYGKQSQINNYCGKSVNFDRDPSEGYAGKEMGRLSNGKSFNDLYNAVRPFLIFGRFIGIIPIQGLFQCDVDRLTFNKSSFSALVSIILGGILSANIVVSSVGMSRKAHTNAGQYAWAPGVPIFLSIGIFTFVYFYRHAWDYIKILRKWNTMNLTFTKPDTTLSRDLNLMALLMMTSAVLENALYSINQLSVAPGTNDSLAFNYINEPKNSSALEIYYIRSNEHWAAVVPFHPIAAMFLFMSNKVALYAWNYMDLTIAFLSRALYHKFKTLYEQSERLLIIKGSCYAQWKQLASDFEILYSMLSVIATFLSPVIFYSFGVNVYFICLQLNLSLNPLPNQTLAESIYTVWSILHLVTRVFILSLCATRINDWAHRLSDIFRKCPNPAYTIEVERAERFVSLNTIGLNGLGCFFVTKPLMLQLAGVVLTFEIVLLQFSQSKLAESACK